MALVGQDERNGGRRVECRGELRLASSEGKSPVAHHGDS